MIRDGVEDYEYLALLSSLLSKVRKLPPSERPETSLIDRAQQLCIVPDDITRSMTDYTKDPGHLFERRRAIADTIERLSK
jgi:hypothetical protein